MSLDLWVMILRFLNGINNYFIKLFYLFINQFRFFD